MPLYLSRLTLRRDPGVAALKSLLQPSHVDRMSSDHSLIWSAFADGADRERDFLWRSEGKGTYFTLSKRIPDADAVGLFDPAETKEFRPNLRAGQRLGFVLRVNATRDLAQPPRPDGKRRSIRVDVVMDAIRQTPPGKKRAMARTEALHPAADEWMQRQARMNGFAFKQGDCLQVMGYATHQLPGSTRKSRRTFGVLDLSGHLTVSEPEAFVQRLGNGFGRAKAFGCGMMMIRPAA